MWFKTIILGFFFLRYVVVCLDIIPERVLVEYINPKYLSYLKMTITKKKRQSPYCINIDFESKIGVGDNMTLQMQVNELLSGRYQPMPIPGTGKACDFLYNEPYVGQMYARQLGNNWSCPFPAGAYQFHDIQIHLENFPFYIPFTWASVYVKIRTDVQGYFLYNKTKDFIFKIKTFTNVVQKPKKL